VSLKRAYISAFLLLAALCAAAIDWRGLVASGGRASNPWIIQVLSESGTADVLEIVIALGERKDPYIADIIDAITSGYNSLNDFRREHLLRLLISSHLDPALPPAVLEARISVNSRAYENLLHGMESFRDPGLRMELLRVMDLLSFSEASPIICGQFSLLYAEMKTDDGHLMPESSALLLSLVSYAARHPRWELLQPCIEVSRTSRDTLIVQSARSAAEIISEALR
jgi:hypothetical protein